jgi:hypothetical protein
MKIIKLQSNCGGYKKPKVILSKKDWENIGKKAGWIKEAGEISDWEVDNIVGLNDNFDKSQKEVEINKSEKSPLYEICKKASRKFLEFMPHEIQSEYDMMRDKVSNREIPLKQAVIQIAKKIKKLIIESVELSILIEEEYGVKFENLDEKSRQQVDSYIQNYCYNILNSWRFKNKKYIKMPWN